MNNKKFFWMVVILGLLSIVTIVIYVDTFGTALSHHKEEWGTFGDYIGGILGTLLAGLTIYLLYITYMAQKDQLKIQTNDFFLKYIDMQYDQLIKDINDISFNNKKGSDALYAWDDSHKVNHNNVVNTLNFILHTFKNHIDTIRANNDLEEKIKEDFYCRAYLMVHSKIIWPVLDKLFDDEAFKGHTDNLFNNFNNLIKDTYNYLVPKSLLSKPDDKRLTDLMPEYRN